MAAVTITVSSKPSRGVPGVAGRVGPTTRPHPRRPATTHAGRRSPRRVSRAVYVRRRLSVAVLAAGLVLVTAQAGAALGGSTHEAPGRAPAFAEVTVRPGDSLWTVAERLAPGEDPRPVVDALAQARRGAPLLPGETVRWAG